jgi:septum formation protein
VNPLLPPFVQENIVLASQSPRRSDILRGLDIDFEIVPPAETVEARVTTTDPFQRPVDSARMKAASVAELRPESMVIGADTVVILDNELLEKPVDDEQARSFLQRLGGRSHTVVTGVAIRHIARGVDLADSESTSVRFRIISPEVIERYVESGEGRDKAGSYAVQGLGACLVKAIDGCFYNVVGLPVSLLFDMLISTAR